MTSLRHRPLLRFEAVEKAKVVAQPTHSQKSMSSRSKVVKKRKPGPKKKGNKGKRGTVRKPRVIKGRVNLRVAGYSGIQKLPPSLLIPYLPANKIKAAAKKALAATGRHPTRGRGSIKRKRPTNSGRKRPGY